jgi:hypothetical protein
MATGARIGAFLGFTWIASTPRAAQSICAIEAAQGQTKVVPAQNGRVKCF